MVLALLQVWLQCLDQAIFGPLYGLTMRALVHPEPGPAKPFFQMTNCMRVPGMMTECGRREPQVDGSLRRVS